MFVVTGRRAPIATKTSAIGRSARFTRQNAANGNEETITIRPDGSAEVRTRGEAPRYGTFAGETLTKTQPDTAHGGGDWRRKAVPSIENRFSS